MASRPGFDIADTRLERHADRLSGRMSTVTQDHIAKTIGLSRSAVATVLNPRTAYKLPEETRRLVLETAERMGYRPNRSAQIMQSGRSHSIGVIYSGGLYQTMAERAYYSVEAVARAGFHPLAFDSSLFGEGSAVAINAMLDVGVDGIVIAGSFALPFETLHHLKNAQIPAVMISNQTIAGVPQIRADNQQGFFDLTRHVLNLGHKHLVHLTTPSGLDGSLADRRRGFIQAVRDADGIVLDTGSAPAAADGIVGEVIEATTADNWLDPFAAGKLAMEAVLARGYLPDVVLCSNDYSAVGAMSACRQAGLDVPRGVAVTGFDNTSLGQYHATVPLTSVEQPAGEMARKAVEILVELIRGRSVADFPALIHLPCRLVFRESCGASRP